MGHVGAMVDRSIGGEPGGDHSGRGIAMLGGEWHVCLCVKEVTPAVCAEPQCLAFNVERG